jgi:hypothetical protein
VAQVGRQFIIDHSYLGGETMSCARVQAVNKPGRSRGFCGADGSFVR